MVKAILLIVLTGCCILTATAQNQKVRLSGNKSITLKKAFRQIEKQTKIFVDYNARDVNDQQIITHIPAPDIVEVVMQELLRNTEYRYVIRNGHIIVSRKKKVELFRNQTKNFTGKVTDMEGEPIVGANIMVTDSKRGTVTDPDGNFTIDAHPDAQLVISFIGFQTKVVSPVDKQIIKLREDYHRLNEVVVLGYTTLKRESLTGALQTLKQDEINDVTTPSAENMLNGKISGVYVASGSGLPGDPGSILIRGKSTINGSTDPLWVIDGVVVGTSSGALNPSEIETITVLKDAASTAIYGSQGANGVIIVTTKNAREGKVSIHASAKIGIANLCKGNMEMMNGAELYDYYNSFANKEIISFPQWNQSLRNSNFDWLDFATQTSFIQDYNISMNGGNERVKTYFSLGIYDETGTVKGYHYQRYNARYKTVYKPCTWLTVKPALSVAKKETDNRQHYLQDIYSNLPWDKPYDDEGNILGHYSEQWVNSNSTNYYYDLQWNYTKTDMIDFSGNLDADVRLTDWLTLSSINNYKWQSRSVSSYTDPRSSMGVSVNGRLVENETKVVRRYTSQLLRLNKHFNQHTFHALLAYEFNDYRTKSIRAGGTGFVIGSDVLDAATLPESVGGTIQEWAVQSYLFNMDYAYDDRYLAQFSLRRDGASNFGNNARYGNFFSVGFGWNIHREKWFTPDWINNLKLRAAYGSVGNRPNMLYPQYDLYNTSSSYEGIPGAILSQIGNDDLTWEKTYTTDFGLDLHLQNRFHITFDWYKKRTSNLLYMVPVPGVIGVTGIWRNIGEVQNKGCEMTFGADLITTKNWMWKFSANIGVNRNVIKALYDDKSEIIISDGSGSSGSASKILKTGLDCDTWYLREWAGVNPDNGSPRWYKTVSRGEYNVRIFTSQYAEADQVPCGTYSPDFFGGFNTYLKYRNFDLYASFGYSVGGQIYNYARTHYDSDGAFTDRNQMKLRKGWSRWSAPGDKATHPLPRYNNPTNSNAASSRYLESGSFLKMRNLTIGYNLALPQYAITGARLFLTGENLFCLTGYSGVDPEIPPASGTITGVASRSMYPSTRKFMFGINLSF